MKKHWLWIAGGGVVVAWFLFHPSSPRVPAAQRQQKRAQPSASTAGLSFDGGTLA